MSQQAGHSKSEEAILDDKDDTRTPLKRRAGQENDLNSDEGSSSKKKLESIIWSDHLLDDISISVIKKIPKDLEWNDYFKAMHSYLAGTEPDDNFLALWLLFLTRTRNPFEQPNNENVHHKRFDCSSMNMKTKHRSVKISGPELVATGAKLRNYFTVPISVKVPARLVAADVDFLVDNRAFHDWYMRMENWQDAQRLFCLLSIIYARAIVEKPDEVFFQLQYGFFAQWERFTDVVKPGAYINMNRWSTNWGSIMIKNNLAKLSRGVLKYLVINMTVHNHRENAYKTRQFYEYALETPFEHNHFHLVRIVDKVLDDYGMTGTDLKNLIHSYDYGDLKIEIENYLFVKDLLRDHYFMHRYYKFARTFEPRCYMEASVFINRSILSFCIGMLPDVERPSLNIYGLRDHSGCVDRWFGLGKSIRIRLKGTMC